MKGLLVDADGKVTEVKDPVGQIYLKDTHCDHCGHIVGTRTYERAGYAKRGDDITVLIYAERAP